MGDEVAAHRIGYIRSFRYPAAPAELFYVASAFSDMPLRDTWLSGVCGVHRGVPTRGLGGAAQLLCSLRSLLLALTSRPLFDLPLVKRQSTMRSAPPRTLARFWAPSPRRWCPPRPKASSRYAHILLPSSLLPPPPSEYFLTSLTCMHRACYSRPSSRARRGASTTSRCVLYILPLYFLPLTSCLRPPASGLPPSHFTPLPTCSRAGQPRDGRHHRLLPLHLRLRSRHGSRSLRRLGRRRPVRRTRW